MQSLISMKKAENNHRVLVFKTNLTSSADLVQIAPLMESDTRIKKWNVDVDDRDKVLRIESGDMETRDVIKMVERAGYQCEELQG